MDTARGPERLSETKVGIYHPFLHILGGGEKYVLTLAAALAQAYEVEVLFHPRLHPCGIAPAEIEARLAVRLDGIRFRATALPPVEWLYGRRATWALSDYRAARRVSAQYGLFIATEMTYGLPPPTFAARSLLLVQAPERRWTARDYAQAVGGGAVRAVRGKLLKQLMYRRAVQPYDAILVYSDFVRQLYLRHWAPAMGRVEVLPPPIDPAPYDGAAPRVHRILSVGRFFEGLHGKKHLFMIQAFQRLVDEGLRGWEYTLVGGLQPEDRAYFERLQAAIGRYPIRLAPNLPFAELKRLYATSTLFWHAAGYGEDETQTPERMEHFGMTTVEAMAAGCVPVVINRGGQREIVRPGLDGALWDTQAELLAQTRCLIQDEARRLACQQNAIARSAAFSTEVFRRRLWRIVASLGLAAPMDLA